MAEAAVKEQTTDIATIVEINPVSVLIDALVVAAIIDGKIPHVTIEF